MENHEKIVELKGDDPTKLKQNVPDMAEFQIGNYYGGLNSHEFCGLPCNPPICKAPFFIKQLKFQERILLASRFGLGKVMEFHSFQKMSQIFQTNRPSIFPGQMF